MHVSHKKVGNIHPKWQLHAQKILYSIELHTHTHTHTHTHSYITSRTLLGFAEVLYSANDVSFIRLPVVVTVCFVTIPHRRKQAEKDNDAEYVLRKKPSRDQFHGNKGLYSWNVFPEVTTAQLLFVNTFLMNYRHLNLTVIKIPTAFFFLNKGTCY